MTTQAVRIGHSLYLVKSEKPVIKNQLSLFDPGFKNRWMKETLAIAQTFHGPFFFSELREKCALAPHHENAWGQVARALLKNGFKRTGQYRRSKTKSRKGGLDWEYERG